ncbi:UDP-2,3-diacylglucosamine diphosphatase [Rubellicoccus peritrichatus]|uniref:UDP-2,3-diacylglucosamine diphosphatase n=1 Tax=Rubellicoccus peritrichatus TaxID=3080537 RepID=A0AAQ3LDK2_9BACT|nr:UDP-2,3-diacylglucosamine diphosphatase [Puniceicoccus sp. CR14]WOO42459.1 UDP-2,3-diacylglucosamine diphosphatase [Puniceicoccus sp. CR14]
MAQKPVLKFRTIILSDIHLGTNDCKSDEVLFFLKHAKCEKLILNGDIIDGWSLKRKNVWPKSHTSVVRRILKLAEKKNTDVIYVRGNHDDFLTSYLPLVFDRLQIVEEHIHKSLKGDYLVVHGDCFDAVTTHSKFISILGDIGYQQLLRLNRLYNKWRGLWGKEYYSVSKAIKARVKSAVNHISKFEDHLQDLAANRKCVGIICGHIHTPEDKMIGDVHYLNSGDWVESMTAIVEHSDGRFEVIGYKEFCSRLNEVAAARRDGVQEAQESSAPISITVGNSGHPFDWMPEDDEAAVNV